MEAVLNSWSSAKLIATAYVIVSQWLVVSSLGCHASQHPNGTTVYTISETPPSDKCVTSWQDEHGTKLAAGEDFNTTLVKELTSRSITLRGCLDTLRYHRDCFPNPNWEEVTCQVNCTRGEESVNLEKDSIPGREREDSVNLEKDSIPGREREGSINLEKDSIPGREREDSVNLEKDSIPEQKNVTLVMTPGGYALIGMSLTVTLGFALCGTCPPVRRWCRRWFRRRFLRRVPEVQAEDPEDPEDQAEGLPLKTVETIQR